MKTRRKQSAVKGRFSAMFISVLVHVAVLIAAGTFVAVTVVQRQEARFEGRQVSRPKMQLQRLQVPQRARTERQAPQMSQRVMAQAVSTRSVDFQMPEIAGLGGGISVDMSGAGFAGSLGFATPQLNLFGLRSQGEKIVFLLNTDPSILLDHVGGIEGYQIIKDEIIRMIRSLPPTALFNVIVYRSSAHDAENVFSIAFSEEMNVASRETIERVIEWITPLNSSKEEIGFSTLAWEGHPVWFEITPPIFNLQQNWMAGLSYALQNRVDTIYILATHDQTNWIRPDLRVRAQRGTPLPQECIIGHCPGDAGLDFSTYPGGEAAFQRWLAEAERLHQEENERRLARGQPERVLPNMHPNTLLRYYVPHAPRPDQLETQIQRYFYIADEIFSYIQAMQRKYADGQRRETRTGVSDRGLVVNVVHFVPRGAIPDDHDALSFEMRVLPDIARRTRGGISQIRGLEGIHAAR